MTNYWVMRTDRRTDEIKNFLWNELKQGRLRQGWGWLLEQDLRVIDATADSDMTDEQHESWSGNRRMLESHGDGIKPDDYILVPHLPQEGSWSVVRRLDAPYTFDLNNGMDDYGHLLHVELLNPERPISFHEDVVAAGLRSTMRVPKRLWNIEHYSQEVEDLLQALKEAKPANIVYNRIPSFVQQMEAAAWEALQRNFKGNEFERPCRLLLQSLYGEEAVEYTAGPNERGADAICSYTDPLNISSHVAVQIKMWDWDADSTEPLHQLREAFNSYENITAGVVMTTSAKTTDHFEEERKKLEAELRIPIRILARAELTRLFMMHLPKLIEN